MWRNPLVPTCGVFLALVGCLCAEDLSLQVTQLTRGQHHHFFGYIGQSLTTPWNASGRYILSLRTTFHDRMPHPGEAADVVLIDTHNGYRVLPIEKCRAWNFQQGTMFYWNPKQPETQFFFNDRDLETNLVFTVLYDIERNERIREYRFEDASVANGGVSPTGEFFLAINYGRMARLRPVTGYPGAADPTAATPAPDNDGIFRVDIQTGAHKLIVSFRQLRDLLRGRHEKIDEVGFYINHSLSNRSGEYVYFYARGGGVQGTGSGPGPPGRRESPLRSQQREPHLYQALSKGSQRGRQAESPPYRRGLWRGRSQGRTLPRHGTDRGQYPRGRFEVPAEIFGAGSPVSREAGGAGIAACPYQRPGSP